MNPPFQDKEIDAAEKEKGYTLIMIRKYHDVNGLNGK